MGRISNHEWASYHTLHRSNVVLRDYCKKEVGKLMFQLAVSNSEYQDRGLRENQASITVAAQLYNQNEKKGLTGFGIETKTLAKRTLSTWSDMPHWPKKTLEQHGKEDGKRRSLQENQLLPLTGKVEIVYQPGYLRIKVEVTPTPCADPQQLWEQQDCREPSIPQLGTTAGGRG